VVLLAEDSVDDAEIARLACLEVGPKIHLHHVVNGRDCLEFLRRQGPYAGAPIPDLVLLDLNMPVMNGFEVLEEITKDPALHHLTVVVLTTSGSEQDVLRTCRLRCNAYIVKPAGFSEFVDVLRGLMQFWFGIARLPIAEAAANRARLRQALESNAPKATT
jgi:CheY-like chemotaxis protein